MSATELERGTDLAASFPLEPASQGSRRWTAAVPEALALAVLYAVYTLLRDQVPSTRGLAVLRGQRLLRLEGVLHLDPEHALNRLVAAYAPLAYLCDYYYAVGHFLITVGVLVLLYQHRRSVARRLAAVWYVSNLLALLGFWLFALAPPRLLPGAGFVDTVVVFHTWGSWGTGAVASAANQYAAMPSLHIAWSSWCAVAVWSLSRRRSLRLAAVTYPAATLFVVLGTANHYLLDALGGVLDLSIAAATVWATDRCLRAVRQRWEPTVAPEGGA